MRFSVMPPSYVSGDSHGSSRAHACLSATALAVACALLLGPWGQVLAQESSPFTATQSRLLAGTRYGGQVLRERVPAVAEDVRNHAGGYGLLTPVVLTVANVTERAARQGQGQAPSGARGVFDFTRNPRFWGGLAGDLAATALMTTVAAAIPGGPFLKALLPCAGGFLGWEIGSGNLAHTDWVSLAGQIAVATVAHVGIMALLGPVGLPGAFLVAGVASAAAGIAFGILFDKWRSAERDVESYQSSEVGGPPETPAPNPSHTDGWGSKPPDGPTAATDRTRRQQVYLEFLEAVRTGQRERAAELHRLLSSPAKQ